ncbi:MAG: PAS domain-containing protein, partial [Acidobacteria bacterium]|nr:PAS domain-containing protein [Acidobacteriota bacterium]
SDLGVLAGGTVHALARSGEDRGYLDEALFTSIEGDIYAKGPVGRSIVTKEPVVVNSVADDPNMKPWHDAAQRAGFLSAMALPLIIEGTVVGSLVLYSNSIDRFTPVLTNTLAQVASVASFALTHYAQRDRLAGLVELTKMRDYALTKISHGLVVADGTVPDFPITFVNTSFEKLTGYTLAEVVGRNCRFLQGPNTDFETVQHMRDALSAKVACDVDLINYKKNGEPFWNHLALFPFFNDDGELIRYVGIISDNSDRQRLESQLAQSQKLEAIGTLAGGIAHDFNNLLLVIQGYASMISSATERDQRDIAATRIQEAIDRGARLTRQLLEYSRQQTHRPSSINLNDAITETLELLEPLIRPGITLKTSLHSPLDYAALDPSQIQQCIFNLVANAADALEDGGTIQLRSRMIGPEQARSLRFESGATTSYVALEVIDDGVGMDEETKKRVFEPFFSTKSEGTGLGLASVYGIVRQSHGHLSVESEVGIGTSFRLYFPAVSVDSELEVPAPRVTRSLVDDIDVFGTETILIVENIEEARHLLVNALRSHGFTVLQASGGPEALEIAQTSDRPIDVLLTDVIMPGMNGHELAEHLLEVQPHLKVIFTSGYTAGLLTGTQHLDENFVVIEKPYQAISVARTIRRLLDLELGDTHPRNPPETTS